MHIIRTIAIAATLTAATLLTMGADGCNQQATAAALMSEVGVDVKAALDIAGVDPAKSQNVANLFQLAASDVSLWKPGTSSDEAVQAIRDADAALSAILPPGSRVQAYVDLALGTAENVITLIQANSTAPAAVAGAATAHSVTAGVPHITLPHPPQTAAQFRKQWAALGGGVPLH